jgi:hypothetical protein
MHEQVQEFCTKMQVLHPEYFSNANVLDVGSLDINGNNRYLFNNCIYTGLDLGDGKNVDIVSPTHLFQAPNNHYDFIISTECFEHDMHWEKSIINIIRMLKPNGAFMFTCASTGRHEHGTERTDAGYSAPFLLTMQNEWKNYYRNLTENDIMSIKGFEDNWSYYYFEYNPNPGDLYFFGVKK